MHEKDVIFVRCRDSEKAWDDEYNCYWYWDGPGLGVRPYRKGEFGGQKMRRTTIAELKEEFLTT